MNKILKIIATILIIFVVIFSCNKMISSKLKEDINNSPAMESFGAKMEIKNIAEMMSKAKVTPKKEDKKPQLVIARGTNRGNKGRPKGVKGRYKMVDSRMKKEVRADKRKKALTKKRRK